MARQVNLANKEGGRGERKNNFYRPVGVFLAVPFGLADANGRKTQNVEGYDGCS
jgi:hypothetical protein